MTALRARCSGVMTSELYMDHLLEDGRELGADVGLECGTERVPDGAGVVRHSTSHCSAREINSVIVCEVSVVRTWEDGGRRLVTARGMRSTMKS